MCDGISLTTIERGVHGGKGKMEEPDWFGFFLPRIERIFTNSALPSDCCIGVSMSARGSSDSAVIDSRYKTRVAGRVSFTVETTVLPSFAQRRAFCRGFSLLVLFVFIRSIRGSKLNGQRTRCAQREGGGKGKMETD